MTVAGSGNRAPMADAAGGPPRPPPAASAAGTPAAAAAAAVATAPAPATATAHAVTARRRAQACAGGNGRVVGWVRRDDRSVPIGGLGGAERGFDEPPVLCCPLER